MHERELDNPGFLEQMHLELVVQVREVDKNEGVGAGDSDHPPSDPFNHNNNLVVADGPLQVLGEAVGVHQGRLHVEDAQQDKDQQPHHHYYHVPQVAVYRAVRIPQNRRRSGLVHGCVSVGPVALLHRLVAPAREVVADTCLAFLAGRARRGPSR